MAALAAEVTRAEYIETVEPVCKKAVEQNANIFRGVSTEIQQGKLKKASRRFTKAAAAFEPKLQILEETPQPDADEQRLGEWISALDYEVTLLKQVGSALRAEKKGRAEHLSKLLHKNANHANNLVLGFGFAYCTLDPGRFV